MASESNNVTLNAIHPSGQLPITVPYEGNTAFIDAVKAARIMESKGYTNVSLDSNRPMNADEFAELFTVVYLDPETDAEHFDTQSQHRAFVERQPANQVWTVLSKNSEIDLVPGFLTKGHSLWVVTEEPWIRGINAVEYFRLHSPNQKPSSQAEDDPLGGIKPQSLNDTPSL